MSRFFAALLLCAAISLSAPAARSNEPRWIRVNTSHYSVLTDADEKRAHDVVVRFEQMRSIFGQLLVRTRINLPEPTDIIAVRSNDEYLRVAPLRDGRTIPEAGFFLAGDDRNYIVLNLSEDDSWRAVSHDFALTLLNYNYPPTQPWFDEGFAEYFSSLQINPRQALIGGDPELPPPAYPLLAGHAVEPQNPGQSFTELLSGPTWLSLPNLFAMHHDLSPNKEAGRHTLFCAESWMVMHYLIDKNKLTETGTYFDLVEIQKMPVADAIQKAFGMAPDQLLQAVKDYFHTLLASLQSQDAGRPQTGGNSAPQAYQVLSPAAAEEIGSSTRDMTEAEARALLAEMMIRLPERREQARKEIDSLIADPKTENAIAHRALSWDHLNRKEFDQATEELTRAAAFDAKDPWLHYYLALVKYRQAASSGQDFQGLANMMFDLRIVLDWDPQFAEAYNMLAESRVEGGGINSAMETMRAAIQLSPRNQTYLLNMAHIYMAGKKWEAATAMLERLRTSDNPEIAQTARKDLEDLPTLKKYGLLPQHDASPQTAPSTSPASSSKAPSTKPSPTRASEPAKNSESSEESSEDKPEPTTPQIDRRPIKYLKGKLVSVDCSKAPLAVLNISVAGKMMKLRTEDYKSLTLIGTEAFSCDWKSLNVAVNYQAGGKSDGDLVTIEVHQ